VKEVVEYNVPDQSGRTFRNDLAKGVVVFSDPCLNGLGVEVFNDRCLNGLGVVIVPAEVSIDQVKEVAESSVRGQTGPSVRIDPSLAEIVPALATETTSTSITASTTTAGFGINRVGTLDLDGITQAGASVATGITAGITTALTTITTGTTAVGMAIGGATGMRPSSGVVWAGDWAR
jgi:hypothetical protein